MTKKKKNNKSGNGKGGKSGRKGKVAGGKRGNAIGKRKVPSGNAGLLVRNALDAFHPMHLPLHTPTGKYLTVKTRRTFTTSDYFSLFGPTIYSQGNSSLDWTTTVGIVAPTPGTVMNGAGWKYIGSPSPHGGDTSGGDNGLVECVPAAFSVQVMCPSSLTAASGIVAMGRLPASADAPGGSDTRIASQFVDSVTSFGNPRWMTGAKLAMAPVQANCVPSNLTEYSNFAATIVTPSDFTGQQWSAAGAPNFAGMAPVYLVNPNNITLQVTVAIEWRVRLSPFNPLHGSGTYHPPVSQDFMHKVMSYASNIGHGVEEVAGVGAVGYALGGGLEAATKGVLSYAAGVAGRALPYAMELAPLVL